MPRKMRFTSPVLLVHTRHYISGEKFIAIIFLFPFLPPFWWHNSVKRKGHTLMPRWFITLIPEGTIDLNNLWLKCISSSAFSLDLKPNKQRNIHHKDIVRCSEPPAWGRRLVSSGESLRSQDRAGQALHGTIFQWRWPHGRGFSAERLLLHSIKLAWK